MSLSYTDALGNNWYIDDQGNLNNAIRAYSSGGSSSTRDTLDYTSMSLYVGTSQPYLTWQTPTVSGNTQTVTGTNTAAGISITRKTYIADGFVRVLEIVTNTGSAATTARIDLTDDIYYDSYTQVSASSSGDTVRTTSDDWATYSSSSNTDYPRLTHIVSGGAGSPSATSYINAYAEKPVTSFDLNLAAGQTKVIMHFYALSNDTAGATTIGNSLANLSDSTYLAGMTDAELNALANFTKDFTASTTTALPSYGRHLTLTGTSAINGTGNALDNQITGNAAANQLFGQAGNDTLNGGAGNDTMAGGTGNDTYYVDAVGDVVNENANEGIDTVMSSISYSVASKPYIENITLTGATAGLTATGNTANNVLNGSQHSGANTLVGGLGNDTYIVGTGDTAVENAGEGTDTVQSSVSWTLAANLENLVLTGSANINGTGNAAANQITGNAGQNKLIGGDGNDTLNGAAGADTMEGGAGNDTYFVDNASDIVTELSGAGIDTIVSTRNYTLGTNLENLTLSGSALKGAGNSLANTLTGNATDNLLDGGAGADSMAGGAGNDTYIVENAGDLVTEAASAGTDTVRSSLSTYTLGTNIENGIMLTGATTFNGNELANRIEGNAASNTIHGGAGSDTLNGLGGNDSISGGDGDDWLVGDNGSAERIVASADTVVNNQVVALNLSAPESATGSIKVTGSISGASLAQEKINIVYVVDRSNSMNGSFAGTAEVGDLNGDGSSNTVLDAAIASVQQLNQSIIQSGLGNQINVTLVQFSSTAEILYAGSPANNGNGNDTSAIDAYLQGLRASGGTAYNAAMTTVKDHLSSLSSGKNIVYFLSDGDPQDGTTYQDTASLIRSLGLSGTTIKAIGMGSGAKENPLDLLDDGIDNNSAIIAMNPEELSATLLNTSVLQLAEGAWIEVYKNGVMVDLIGSDRFSISPLGVRFESEAITLSASGTDQISAKLMTMSSSGAMIQASLPIQIGSFVSNDTLDGGLGNDTLDGGIGADVLRGGAGNDTYVVDNASDQVAENADEGLDTVRSTLAAYTLGANVENLQLLGSALNGTGNELSNILAGNEQNNMLSGNNGDDTISGGLGNDTLNGGAGNDSMTGGAGNDTYYIDATYDVVSEESLGGVDTVITSFNTTLGGYISGISTSDSLNYIENLTLLAGSSAINAVGSDFHNMLQGNANDNKLYGLAGNDTLNGGAGVDTMDGGEGNDTYHVDSVGDVIIDASGVDTVIASYDNYVLGAGLENLTLINNASVLKGTGNAAANILTGNSYNNILNGQAGADTMTGGSGNDTYYVDNANDKLVELLGGGFDTVMSSVSHKLSDNFEKLQLTGSNGIAGAGNSQANIIAGNSGANRLMGWDGNDTLVGGAGNDTLIGGAGQDIFRFDSTLGTNVTPNIDQIIDFVAADDTIHLENSIFTSFGTTTTGTINAGFFTANTTGVAADSNDYLVYETDTGKLFYDADGSGAGASVQIALLGTSLPLTNADFALI